MNVVPPEDGDCDKVALQEDAAAIVQWVEANLRAHFEAPTEERGKAHVVEELDNLGNFVEYEDEDVKEEEKVARLETKELERQIAQKK